MAQLGDTQSKAVAGLVAFLGALHTEATVCHIYGRNAVLAVIFTSGSADGQAVHS